MRGALDGGDLRRLFACPVQGKRVDFQYIQDKYWGNAAGIEAVVAPLSLGFV